ncbi:hypothetical protein G9A89_022470 [Geosiphon pyriformis]|nr:hypothetical protein G9A89_022470 [Geosiphon pyriformis]
MVDKNTKTLIEEIDNFPFKIDRIQISTKILVIEATQYQALVGNNWLLKANVTLDWNTQELQLTFNRQHAQVPAICRHFKTQCIKELLIEFENTPLLPTIETYQKLAPTREEQEQKLADLNTKLCNHCLISCHFQYCNKCDFMFNSPSRILIPITKLLEPEEKKVLITEDMLFQNLTKNTKTKQYLAYPDLSKELELKWYSDNEKRICFERVHDTNASFDLQYPRQLPIIIAPHSFVKIDLKIALEILVSTIVQVAFQSNLAKKGINVKREIINAGYMGNIIIMLQNNLNRPYKIESQEKFAQAIFLSLVKILQLTSVTT